MSGQTLPRRDFDGVTRSTSVTQRAATEKGKQHIICRPPAAIQATARCRAPSAPTNARPQSSPTRTASPSPPTCNCPPALVGGGITTLKIGGSIPFGKCGESWVCYQCFSLGFDSLNDGGAVHSIAWEMPWGISWLGALEGGSRHGLVQWVRVPGLLNRLWLWASTRPRRTTLRRDVSGAGTH